MKLIDADKLRDILNNSKQTENIRSNDDWGYFYQKGWNNAIGIALMALIKMPTIESEPVRHGRWERTSDGAAYCTACKRKMSPSQYGYGFCGLCGAKMDLK